MPKKRGDVVMLSNQDTKMLTEKLDRIITLLEQIKEAQKK
jgi:hypothetical protein